MSDPTLINKNSIVAGLSLLEKKPWYRWAPVWPFIFLYTFQCVVYADPSILYGKVTYLIWMEYIDFGHAVMFPFLIFTHAFFTLSTQWSVAMKVWCLFRKHSVKDVFGSAKNQQLLRKLSENSGSSATSSRSSFEISEMQAQGNFLGFPTHVYVQTYLHKGESMIVPLQWDQRTTSIFFMFQKRKWSYDSEEKRCFCKPSFPTKLPMVEYQLKAGISSDAQKEKALNSFGKNEVKVEIPTFLDLFADHAFAPFFVFQMFCVLLWCLDEYWMYSLFTGFMMVVLEGTVCFQRLRNMQTLNQMSIVPNTNIQVLRNGKYVSLPHTELLPMDVVVIPTNAPCPADIVLVSGTCVVDESMLTGESTPQMKESLPRPTSTQDSQNWVLNLKRHSRHVVFGGTKILLSSFGSGGGGSWDVASASTKSAYPQPFSNPGCLGVVLRVGFETKQGKLIRTILHSQSRISENSGEAFAFIACLLVFAIAAVIYAVERGLADPNRSRWKLFLTCAQIITSVVPPELPMELSLAVNTSLMALMKLHVFCTEPFRIPFAGKTDFCCFDKTGTLTTDEMILCGVDLCDEKMLRSTGSTVPLLTENVLSSCHSLVTLDTPMASSSPASSPSSPSPAVELAGDAMEKAALNALRWKCEKVDVIVKEPPLEKETTESSSGGKSGSKSSNSATSGKTTVRTINVLTRFPFVPELKRMSCIVTSSHDSSQKYVVSKGSPETMKGIFSVLPDNYNEVYRSYATKGFRVIALGYKALPSELRSRSAIMDMERDVAESDLFFAGFAVFQCPLKKDSASTIQGLQRGSHFCCIITGDSVDTAIAVGKEVGILEYSTGKEQEATSSPQKPIVIAKSQLSKSDSTSSEIVWEGIEEYARGEEPRTFSDEKTGGVVLQRCVNAEVLSTTEFTRVMEKYADEIGIWARCAPDQKEKIVSCLKAKGRMVLMAGDGTNDVGGLKQAHVGIAVLNSALIQQNAQQQQAQVATAVKPSGVTAPDARNYGNGPMAQMFYNFPISDIPAPIPANAGFGANMKYQFALAKRKAELQRKDQLEKSAIKEFTESKAKGEEVEKPKAPVDPTDFSALSQSLFNEMGDDGAGGGGAPLVKLGDASIAAPFTCKSKKMGTIIDIVRLGRCTLVTTLQMYKILALNCLTMAYTMSVLHSDGVKFGDKQLMLQGVTVAFSFLMMSRSKPIEVLSVERPITRVFHRSMVVSILGQFGFHLYSLIRSRQIVAEADYSSVESQRNEVDSPDFKPTLLNSILFIMTTVTTVATYVINYRGRPFMASLTENKFFMLFLVAISAAVLFFALEIDPEINEMLEIVPFPSEEFRYQFVQIILTDVIGSFCVEQFCRRFLK